MGVNTDHQKMIEAIKEIKRGPRVLQLYMEICAKCGTCAEQCHVSRANPDKRINPAARSDLVRALYKRYVSRSGKILGSLVGARDVGEEELDVWARDFYECSGCRRCAAFCPLGIDNSVITRKGRAIVHMLGKTPKKIAETQKISDQTGNDEGQGYAAFMDAVSFLEQEMKEETGVDVKIPVDQEGADILFVPASADLISFPDTQIGSSKFFHAAGVRWTMSSQAFDGANFGLFSGDDQHMKNKNKLMHNAAQKLKVKKVVIGECGHAYRIAKCMAHSFWGNLPYEVTNILSMAVEYLRQGKLKLDPGKNPDLVTYHDPCNFSRSCGVTEEPRELIKACCQDFREMIPNRAENWCCGGGGGLAVLDSKEGLSLMDDTFLEYRMTVGGKMKLEQIKATGAKFVAAPCSNCKRQISQLMEYHQTGVEVGGVMDLFSKAIEIKK